MTYDFKQINRNIAEGKRLLGMTSYQRANERAADRKADAWLKYAPLTAEQLAYKDDDTHTLTLNVGVFGQFVVLKRPTEQKAIRHLVNGHPLVDLIVERRAPREKRWCIFCKDRHPLNVFIQSKRYLNGYSYACKTSLREAKRRHWRFLSEHPLTIAV